MFIRYLTQMIVALFQKSPLGKSTGKQREGYKCVSLPDYTLVVGIITIIFTLVIFGLSLVFKAPGWVPALWIVFSLLGFYLIIAWKNIKVLYNDEKIIETTFLGKEKHYTYDEFVSCEEKTQKHVIKYYTADGRVLKVDQSIEDAIYLDIAIKSEYKKLHNNKNIPIK
ncbi:MAG: hypothetical protein J6L89_02815 [Clostridia bacterium]|nr:hypothetical protein [Clostridia bacterium]